MPPRLSVVGPGGGAVGDGADQGGGLVGLCLDAVEVGGGLFADGACHVCVAAGGGVVGEVGGTEGVGGHGGGAARSGACLLPPAARGHG